MGAFSGTSGETSSPEGALLAGKPGSLQSWGTGAMQDGQAGKKLAVAVVPLRQLSVAAGKTPSCTIASAHPSMETGGRRAGRCGTARTSSSCPGSHTGPSIVTLQSRQALAMWQILDPNKKFWVSVCLEMEFNGGARVKVPITGVEHCCRLKKRVYLKEMIVSFSQRKPAGGGSARGEGFPRLQGLGRNTARQSPSPHAHGPWLGT